MKIKLISIILLFIFSGCAITNQKNITPNIEKEIEWIEKEKINLEYQRLELEKEKLEFEKQKNKYKISIFDLQNLYSNIFNTYILFDTLLKLTELLNEHFIPRH